MKITDSLRKVGAAAGSALMLGMTLGSAATLADFPGPFVNADGQVQSQIVVGSQGKQADVVGAINVAAALGNSAVATEQRTATGTAASWTAGQGAVLDTRNDRLRFGDRLDAVRDTLTADHLSVLGDTTFTDDAGDDTDIEYYLYPGDSTVTFGKPDDRSSQDPVLYVDNPSSVTATSNLYRMQANFEDGINFTEDAVLGEDVELFGTEYTVSESDTTASELVLFGSTQTLSLSTSGRTSGTVTVGGEEHTIEIDGVNDNGVIYRVDGGTWQQKIETKTFTVEGETVRIDDVINRVDDAGSASFEVGSEELHLTNGDPVEDGDGDDVDGTYVRFNGDATATDPVDAVSSIDIAIGAADDDHEYVMAGESYTHPSFGNVEFHFGGLSPDMAETSGGDVTVDTSGDETATVSFTDDSGDTATVEAIHTPDSGSTLDLADDDGDGFVVVEGDPVAADEYVPTDAGGFTHLWQVTSIDRDDSDGTLDSGDEAAIDLKDQVSGASVTIDVDAQEAAGGYASGDEYYSGTEVIDGQTYHVVLEGGDSQFSGGDSDAEFKIAWGTDSGHASGTSTVSISTGSGASGATTQYPSLELDSGARLAFYDPGQTASGLAIGTSLDDFNTNEFFVDDTTQSTEDANGYGDGDPIARVINQHDATFDLASGDSILAFGTDARYLDGGDSTYNAGDEVYIDDDQDTVYTGQGDLLLDADGSTSNATGTQSASTTDQLVPFQASDRVAYSGPLTGSTYDLWIDGASSDNNQYDAGTGDTVLFNGDNSLADGTVGSGAETATNLKYVDEGSTSAYADGDDIFLDQGGNGTVSASADTQVNAGTDGTFDATDGQALLDLDEATHFAVDVDSSSGINTGDEVAFAIEGSLAGGDTVAVFPTTTRHTGSQPYNASETVVDDADDSGTYTPGDTVFGSATGTVRSYSSDPTETDGLSSAAQTMITGLSDPAVLIIEEEDDDEDQEVTAATVSWDAGNSQVDLDTPQFSDAAKATSADLESDSDVTAGYDVYGAYSWYDSDDQGTFTLSVPDGQSAAGAAYTAPGGSLGASGAAGGTYEEFTGTPDLPAFARLDTEITSAQREQRHFILVGGPAVNRMVKTLADRGRTWSQQTWFQHEDEAILQVVNNAFTRGKHALIVAGYGADDTRAAARYISDYAAHEQDLADAGNRLVLSTSDYPSDR